MELHAVQLMLLELFLYFCVLYFVWVHFLSFSVVDDEGRTIYYSVYVHLVEDSSKDDSPNLYPFEVRMCIKFYGGNMTPET